MLNEKIQQETPTNFIPGTTKTQNQLNQNPNPNQAQDCPTNIPLEEKTRYEHRLPSAICIIPSIAIYVLRNQQNNFNQSRKPKHPQTPQPSHPNQPQTNPPSNIQVTPLKAPLHHLSTLPPLAVLPLRPFPGLGRHDERHHCWQGW